ncbi:hypothetical protein DL771_007548 [Monosporascus sp. 5C6A]|nr:hypothetical protein DL771_007548 [Monosporascus sp. 5C6A]
MSRRDPPNEYGSSYEMLSDSGAECVFFLKGLTGPFAESQAGVFEIHEQDPGLLDLAINWLYTATIDCNDNDPFSVAKFVDLLVLADYLNIESLKAEILLRLRRTFESGATRFHGKRARVAGNGTTEKSLVDDLFSVARVAYANHSASFTVLRQISLDFVANTRYLAACDSHFISRAKDVPLFAADLFELLMTNDQYLAEGMLARHLPTACARCNMRNTYHPITWLEETWNTSSYKVAGYCRACNSQVRKIVGRLNTDDSSHSLEMKEGNVESGSSPEYASSWYTPGTLTIR